MNNIEFRLALHAHLCDLADTLMLHYNPCEAHAGVCRMGSNPIPCCVKTRFVRFDKSEYCYYLGDAGCQVMNIHCKTWFCKEVEKYIPFEMAMAMKCIKWIAETYGLMEARA